MDVREQYQWTIYFAAIVSMQFHPGADQRGHNSLSLRACATVADEMLKITRERAQGEFKCPG